MDWYRKELQEMGVACYTIGQPFDKTMPGDGAIFEMIDGQCVLVIGLSGISKTEREAVDHGTMQVGINVIDGILFICVNCNKVLFFEAPFHAGLYPEFALEPVPAGMGYPVLIILVENQTNIIRAMRVVGLDHQISKILYREAQKQRKLSICKDDYDEKLNQVYAKYESGEIMKQSICFKKYEA